jgi:uncharacterized membrane protein YdjX (TVP38/TMEM64 family)
VAYFTGARDYLSLEAIAEHRAMLKDLVARNLILAVAVYMLVYVAIVALSLPGAALLTILGGFLFGWMLSALLTVVAATLGAMVIFEIVRTSLGAVIAERANRFVERLRSGFEGNALSYLLFLRLVPLFPFFAVNAVAGLLRIRLPTFAIATLIGIIPATLIFSYLGSGLDAVIDEEMRRWHNCVAQAGEASCRHDFNPSSLLTPGLIAALILLALLALVPVVLQKFKSRRT